MKRFKEIGERERDKGKNEKGRVLGRVTALFMPITLSVWMTKICFFTLPSLPSSGNPLLVANREQSPGESCKVKSANPPSCVALCTDHFHLLCQPQDEFQSPASASWPSPVTPAREKPPGRVRTAEAALVSPWHRTAAPSELPGTWCPSIPQGSRRTRRAHRCKG